MYQHPTIMSIGIRCGTSTTVVLVRSVGAADHQVPLLGVARRTNKINAGLNTRHVYRHGRGKN